MIDPSATRFECITFMEVLEKQLKVMDASAISLCMDNDLPIIVFNMRKQGNIARVVTSGSGSERGSATPASKSLGSLNA